MQGVLSMAQMATVPEGARHLNKEYLAQATLGFPLQKPRLLMILVLAPFRNIPYGLE